MRIRLDPNVENDPAGACRELAHMVRPALMKHSKLKIGMVSAAWVLAFASCATTTETEKRQGVVAASAAATKASSPVTTAAAILVASALSSRARDPRYAAKQSSVVSTSPV